MNKRSKVITASAMTILGVAVISGNYFSADVQLQAATLAENSFDLTKYFLWAGIGLVVISALMFIGASSE